MEFHKGIGIGTKKTPCKTKHSEREKFSSTAPPVFLYVLLEPAHQARVQVLHVLVWGPGHTVGRQYTIRHDTTH